MRILITGASGFLGRSLLEYAIKNSKHDIFTLSRSPFKYYQHIQCDLLDIESVKKTLEIVKPELIFHLANNPAARPNPNNPSQILRDNIEGTHNLIYSLQNRPRVIFSSSATVYGYYPKKHPPYWDSPTHPISLYATTKLACENIIRVYTTQDKINGTSVRIPALTGINATHGLIKDLIAKLESDSEKLHLIGKGNGTIKPFIHVDETAEMLYKIGVDEKGYDEIGLTCLIGTPDSLSVRKIAEIVMEELEIKKEIVFDTETWAGDNLEMYLSPCFSTKLNSEESIRKTIQQYKGKV